MAGSNGYGTIGQLKALRRLEKDFTDWPEMKLRVQALTDEEVRLIGEYSRDPDKPDQADMMKDRNGQIAYGLVQPDLKAHEDLDTAVAVVEKIPAGVRAVLSGQILGLTYARPQEAYRDFDAGVVSADPVEGSEPSTSLSAKS